MTSSGMRQVDHDAIHTSPGVAPPREKKKDMIDIQPSDLKNYHHMSPVTHGPITGRLPNLK